MKLFETKTTDLKVKDIDTGKGIVKGYFASFNTVDSDNDIFQKGCFSKSIQENGPASSKPRIKHLAFHNPEMLAGKLIELGEDETGLYFTSQMSKTQLGQDILTQYEEGILTEHSVGFIMLQNQPDREKGFNIITETKLFEGSTVTWGANMNTPVTELKDLMHQPEKVLERYNKLASILHKGKISDELGLKLELEILQLQKLYNDIVKALDTKKPDTSDSSTFNREKPLNEINTLLDETLKRLSKWN